jgi:hypothetical protein
MIRYSFLLSIIFIVFSCKNLNESKIFNNSSEIIYSKSSDSLILDLLISKLQDPITDNNLLNKYPKEKFLLKQDEIKIIYLKYGGVSRLVHNQEMQLYKYSGERWCKDKLMKYTSVISGMVKIGTLIYNDSLLKNFEKDTFLANGFYVETNDEENLRHCWLLYITSIRHK